MTAKIAEVTGTLHLTISGGEPIALGSVQIPITATTGLSPSGELILSAAPNFREVKELIEQVFGAEGRKATTNTTGDDQ